MSDDRPDLPQGMSKEDFDGMMEGASELTDMAATAGAIYEAYMTSGFSPSQALYCTMAVLTGNPLSPPRV